MGHDVREPHPRPAVIVAVACYCGIVVALTQTMIIPLVPVLPQILHSSPADASWAITATLLAGAVVMPIAGRLGDMVGKRLMLLVSLSALVAGSLICALFDSLVPVVAGRGLQGSPSARSRSASASCATSCRRPGSGRPSPR